MKKFTIYFFALFFVLGTAVAQNADKKWAIGLGAGVEGNIDQSYVGFMPELYLSRYLSPSLDLMLKNDLGLYSGAIDVNNTLLNLRYKFANGKMMDEDAAFQPYLFGGVGYLQDNETSGVNFDGGVGAKFPISPNTSIYVEGAYLSGIDATFHGADVKHDFWKATLGLEFAFGAAKDSDGDGVSDKKDKCPGTPPGVAVDENGCPLDRDGDGVPDYKDDCPDEAGLEKFNGCPDTDGDGIPDKDDECPTVAGLAKFKGCPDTDEDGVPDSKDKCPNTPKGCPVDANGCPLDSDGDGVIDCEDKCPTEAGPASNNGCPDWVTLEIPTIYFDLNKSNLKDEGKVELDKLASQLNASKEYDIVIGGHACDLGTDAYNMKLSEKRAQEVVKYLLMKGVNNAFVGSNNYGESKPAVENSSEPNRKKNRRVEFEVAKIRK